MWTEQEKSRWERNLRAMVVSAGNNDPEAFADLVAFAHWLRSEGLRDAYSLLRAQGFSGGEIAGPLRISRQAVHDRFGRR